MKMKQRVKGASKKHKKISQLSKGAKFHRERQISFITYVWILKNDT